HLPQHPLPGRSLDLSLQCLEVGIAEQRRHLHQPSRGMLAEECDDALAAGFPAQPSQRLEDRQVSLTGPVLLATPPTRYPRRPRLGDLLEEGIHHRRLPDSRLARHEHDLALAAERLLLPALQLAEFCLAPHQENTRSPQSRIGPGGRRDGRDEAVPPPPHRLDEARRRAIIAQYPAQLANASLRQSL